MISLRGDTDFIRRKLKGENYFYALDNLLWCSQNHVGSDVESTWENCLHSDKISTVLNEWLLQLCIILDNLFRVLN